MTGASPPSLVTMSSVSDIPIWKYWRVGLKRATPLRARGIMRSYPMNSPHQRDPQPSYDTTTTGHDQRHNSHRVHDETSRSQRSGGEGRAQWVG